MKADDEPGPPKGAGAKRKCIVVAGMHRSGTSALTRVLSLLGARLPEHVMVENSSNVKGYWEPERLVAVHDKMLAEAGSRWEDWRAFPLTTLGTERLAYYKEEMARIVLEEYTDAPLFVIKDPRVCRLMPLWREILDNVGVELLLAIPFRNPIEVARSLKERDDFLYTQSYLLWLRDVLEVEYETRGTPRVFVRYDELLRRPVQTASHVMSQLMESWPEPDEQAKQEIESFIEPKLRHHVATEEDVRQLTEFSPWMWETYDACATLVHSPSDEKAQHRLDLVRAAFDPICESFAPLFASLQAAVKERDAKIVVRDEMLSAREIVLGERDERIATLGQTLAAFKTALSERDKKLAMCGETLKVQETALNQGNEKIATLDRTLAACKTALSERDKKIAMYDETLKTREAVLNRRNEKIATLDQALTACKTALNERDKKIEMSNETLMAREAALNERDERIASIDQMLADNMTRLTQCEAAIGALHASKSWRFTAPLRALRKLVARQ